MITLHFGKSDSEFYLCAQTLQSAMDALEVKPEPPASHDEIFVLLGDADGNGKINVKDATEIQKFLAGLNANENIGTYIPVEL